MKRPRVMSLCNTSIKDGDDKDDDGLGRYNRWMNGWMDGIELLGLLRLFVPTSFRVKAGGTTQVWVRICRAARRKRTFPLESNPDMPESAMTLRISQKGTNRGSPQQSQESQIKLNQMK